MMHSKLDAFEEFMLQFPEPAHRTIHRFTPGLYSRTFIMPAGSIWTSKIHRHEHQFVILRGLCSVRDVLTDDWVHLSAPHHGITKAGTRRLLVIHEETVFTTFHPNPTDETDLTKLEELLIEPHAHSLAIAEQRRAQCLGLQ